MTLVHFQTWKDCSLDSCIVKLSKQYKNCKRFEGISIRSKQEFRTWNEMFKQMPRSIEEIVSQMSTQNQYSHTDSAEFIFAAKIECCPLNKNEVHFAELWKHVIPMEKCYSKFIFYFVASNFRKCLEPRAVIQSNHPHAAVLSVADSYSQKTNRTSSSCAVWETILKFTLRFNINFISVFCMENNMAICLMKRTGTKKTDQPSQKPL